ncbi:hypothetical protein AB1L88_12265 [Tautonia sp. JC769]|uniref:hypothetical protein n=1 Tax=Tautonia sp. JC769 TaxID=3232135 RepID=UPI0034578051
MSAEQIETGCTTSHNKRRFVVREKRSSVCFTNQNEHKIDQIKVDGCAIEEGMRCDYLVNVDSIDASILIELKGGDVEKAIKQLDATNKRLACIIKNNITWIVSSTKCPLASTAIQVLKVRIKKQANVTLRVQNTPVEHNI